MPCCKSPEGGKGANTLIKCYCTNFIECGFGGCPLPQRSCLLFFFWATLTACGQFPAQVSEMFARRWPPTKKLRAHSFQQSTGKTSLEMGHRVVVTGEAALCSQLLSELSCQCLTTLWNCKSTAKPQSTLAQVLLCLKLGWPMVHRMPSLGQKLYFFLESLNLYLLTL